MVFSIRTSCRRFGKALSANSVKARENVASLGTSPTLFPALTHELTTMSPQVPEQVATFQDGVL